MATLIRITGKAGTEIYSAEHYSPETVKEAYIEEHGIEPDKDIEVSSFDCLTGTELIMFVMKGCP